MRIVRSQVGRGEDSFEVGQPGVIDSKEADVGSQPSCKRIENLPLSEKWARTVQKIQRPFENAILYLAKASAKKPKLTISLVVCFSFFVLIVGLVTNFELNADTDIIWAPFNSAPVKHEEWIENVSGFPPDPRILTLLFHEENIEDHNSGVLLRQKAVNQVFIAVDAVRNMTEYQTLCRSVVDDSVHVETPTLCRIEGIIRFWNESHAIFQDQVHSDQSTREQLSAYYLPDGTPVPEDAFFGKPVRDEDGTLASVQVYMIRFEYPQGQEAESFESQAIEKLLNLRDEWRSGEGNLLLEINGERSFADESVRAVLEDITLVPIVFVVMTLFTCFVFFDKDQAHSRTLLGFGAVVSVLLSMMTGYGIMFVLGVPLTPITQIMPFIVFGIGLDDAYILRGAYLLTDSSKDAPERISETIQKVGLSLFLTTITSSSAFALGCISSIPIVFWLCLYAVPTILMVLFYQLTFFVACIVLDEKRIKRGRRGCLVCLAAKSTESERVSSGQSALSFSEKYVGQYAEQIVQPRIKVAVVLIFASLFGACSYSTSKMTHKFKPTDMLPPASYSSDFLETLYDGGLTVNPTGVYFRYTDQSNTDIHFQINNYVNDLESIDAISRAPTYFWLRDFQVFVNETVDDEQSNFVDQLDAFLSSDVYRKLYSRDIVRGIDGTIISSRCWMNIDNVTVTDVHSQIKAYGDQLSITSLQPINEDIDQGDWPFFSYTQNYLMWSFFYVLVDEFIMTTLLAIVAVTAVTLLFIPHWTASLFTLPLICILYIDLIGIMQIAGIHINMLSYITILLAIGLLVDFIMHVLLRFYEVHGTRTEKTKIMLQTMGPSIFTAGISTILGTLPLAFASGGIFWTIFVSFVSLVALGLTHGLVLLPVVLATFGPEDCKDTIIVEEVETELDVLPVKNTADDEPKPFNSSRLSI